MELALLHDVAAERHGEWEAAGIGWEIVEGPPTDKPAAWLILRGESGVGQLTVWVSGEAEMDWARQSSVASATTTWTPVNR